MRRVALGLAVAAVAVAAPRLVLIFLEADSLEPANDVRAALLGASGAALALVLTGGAAYLVHAIVRVGRYRGLLFGLWILILTSIATLITPRLVAGLERARTPLAQVLSTGTLRWGWSFVAVLAAELVATGCMLAYAAEHTQHHELQHLLAELEQLGRSRNQLQQQLAVAEQQLQRQHAAGVLPAPAAGAATAAAGSRAASSAAGRYASDSSASSQLIPCRYGCGFLARNSHAERGHLASCPQRPPKTTSAEQPFDHDAPTP